MAIAMDLKSKECDVFKVYDRKTGKTKLFISEKAAETFIKKEFGDEVILYGLFPDPTPMYEELRKK